MYLKTPKRYRSGYRGKQPKLFSPMRFVAWLVLIALIGVGIGIYENRDLLRPVVENVAGDVVDVASEGVNQIRATEIPPTRDPSDDMLLAERAWDRGAMEDAITYYSAAMPSLPNDLLAHYRLTMALINQGQYASAVMQGADTVTASPFSPDAWSIYAMALNRIGQEGDAISAAGRALELAPERLLVSQPEMANSRARALAVLGEAYLNRGDSELARRYASEAIELNPDSFEALNLLGRIAQEVDYDNATALAYYQDALDTAPNLPYLAIWVGWQQRWGANPADALATFRAVLEQNPNNTLALYEVGSYYFSVDNNVSEAYNYFNRCVEVDPNNAQCLYLLGRTLLDAETISYSPQQAQQYLLRAHEADPNNARVLYWLAEAHMVLGQCQQAIPYMELGLQVGRETGDQVAIDGLNVTLPEARVGCGIAPATATPAPTPEGESSGENT